MRIEVPTDVGTEVLKKIIGSALLLKPKSELAVRPFEYMIYNLFTQRLREEILERAQLADAHDRLHRMADVAKEGITNAEEHEHLLMSLLTMLVHKYSSDRAVLLRETDAEWYGNADVKLQIEKDDDRVVLTVLLDDDKEVDDGK